MKKSCILSSMLSHDAIIESMLSDRFCADYPDVTNHHPTVSLIYDSVKNIMRASFFSRLEERQDVELHAHQSDKS